MKESIICNMFMWMTQCQIKLKFYKICTQDFAKEQFERIKVIYQWLMKTIAP